MSEDFEGQRKGEKVVFVFRRHILTARKGMFFFVLMVAIGVLPMLIWQGTAWTFWTFVGLVLVGLLGWGYAYILWYFSIYLITNERLRQIRQKGIFRKSVVDLGLDKIESVSYEVPGVMGGIFGYGTLLVQTAAGDLVVSSVRKPEAVYNKLQDAMKMMKKETSHESA